MESSVKGKRKLILLVNGYPYGHREPYIEAELPYLVESFDEILLVALNIRSRPEPEIPEQELDYVRDIPYDNVTVLPIVFASKVVYITNGICCLWDANFWRELGSMRKAGRLNGQTFFALMKYISRARYEARRVSRYIEKNRFIESADDVMVYSYRFDYQPYIGLLLKRRWPRLKVVARAHGRDLYEDRVRANYIPLREALLEGIESVYCISEHGKNYLQEKFPDFVHKVHLRRLGTVDHGWCQDLTIGDGQLRIASCSFLVPVKRVSLIAEALMQITDFEVEWIHFGGGPEEERLKELCSTLPENVKVDFRGTVANDVVLDEYVRNPFHVFINVSESEGVPVSIMEALSTGTPVIATDVGGTGEIIHDRVNGWLVPTDVTTDQIEDGIRLVRALNHEALTTLRRASRQLWMRECNSEEQYRSFAADLAVLTGGYQ